MSRRSLLEATVAALVALVAWWGGVLHLDGALAANLPYHQYETVALLYPDVFYPGVPGIHLARVLYSINADAALGSLTFYVGLLGWTLASSAAIGAVASRYASGRGASPKGAAVGIVVALFVAVTAVEAVSMFAG